MELRERERKVDVNSMSPEEVEVLIAQLGERLRQICDDAAQKANSMLNIYGMNAKIAIAFDTLPTAMEKMVEKPKKRRTRSKKSNLNKEPGQ